MVNFCAGYNEYGTINGEVLNLHHNAKVTLTLNPSMPKNLVPYKYSFVYN